MPRSLTARTLPFASLAIGALSVMLASGPSAGAATTTTVAIPTAFCNQVKTSQTAIASATGATKLSAIAAQWTKIESAAPATIKGSVDVIRTAYEAAAKAGNDSAVKTTDVTAAGKAVTTFYTQRCGNYTRPVDNGGPDGDNNDGGPRRGFDNTAFEAYRACLAKNGLNLPAPGGNRPANGATPTTVKGKAAAAPAQINPSDPKVIAAMNACKSLLPAGAQGGFGGFGGPNGGRGGRGNFGAIQACLTKKGVNLQGAFGRRNGANGGNGANGAAPAPGANGAPAAGGQPPQIDAKTQAAIEACRKEAAAAAPSTTLKKV